VILRRATLASAILPVAVYTAATVIASGVVREPVVLRRSSSATWQMPPPSAMSNTQCDADGDIYFKTSLSSTDVGLLKVSADGSKYQFYKMPTGDADSVSYQFRAVNVTRGGDLRVLAYSSLLQPYIFLFAPDLNGTSKVRLEPIEHLQVVSFAAFESGATLIAGYYDEHADKKLQGKPFLAVFDASGKIKARVSGRFDNVDLSAVHKKLSEGGSSLGEDGFLYLLRANEIVVVSEFGAVIRRMAFQKPDPEWLAVRVVVSEGIAVVELLKDEGRGKAFGIEFLALNASTGEPVALYRPEPELGNNFLCFSRTAGFSFMEIKDGKVVQMTASGR
jgi:hypothetical protein